MDRESPKHPTRRPDLRRTRRADPGEDDRVHVLFGTVQHVTYRDEESLFTVLRIKPERSGGEAEVVAAVGLAAKPAAGQKLRLAGRWTEHPRFGRRFEFSNVEILAPTDPEGLVRYLSSRSFRGVGEKTARRIVEKLGSETLEAIREDPSCLSGIRGLSAKARGNLATTLSEHFTTHLSLAFLRGVGLGPAQSATALRRMGPECETLLRRNPYRLAREVPGLGFATADRIAGELGIGPESPLRARAALFAALERGASDGHTFLPAEALFEAAGELLRHDVPRELLEGGLEALSAEDEVRIERERQEVRVFLPALAVSEAGLAAHLTRLLRPEDGASETTPGALDDAAHEAGLHLHEEQRAAVDGLSRCSVGLLTGGPGVGKTTIVRLLVELAEASGRRVSLASPTGRAAKRLSEAAGHEAKTIHRLLGFNPHTGGFAANERNPLETDLLVVDEISMLDVILAYHLVRAVKAPTRLVLVGDPHQLPAVGAGNVLSDLLASELVPTWRLTKIFRQRTGSRIVRNAHRILQGELPEFPARGEVDSDFYFFPSEEPEPCAERVVEVVTRRVPERFDMEWIRDVQVLSPMYRGACGVDALNARLREALGAGGREVRIGDRTWRTGDRVIHTRNDYDRDIYNGDMGRIASILSDGTILVAFADREVEYGRGELSDLQPAFAMTVHRSQGGEFPAVVIPILPQFYMMLQRNLLYTAVTRARRLVVLVGSQRALRMAVDNEEPSRRRSSLAERLRALASGEAS